jgi:hypothetical protein
MGCSHVTTMGLRTSCPPPSDQTRYPYTGAAVAARADGAVTVTAKLCFLAAGEKTSFSGFTDTDTPLPAVICTRAVYVADAWAPTLVAVRVTVLDWFPPRSTTEMDG